MAAEEFSDAEIVLALAMFEDGIYRIRAKNPDEQEKANALNAVLIHSLKEEALRRGLS